MDLGCAASARPHPNPDGTFGCARARQARCPSHRAHDLRALGTARLACRRGHVGCGIAAPTENVTQQVNAMNWDRIEGNWKQFRGNVRERWGKLTDDQLDVIAGKREQLAGKLQEAYGYSKDQAEREIGEWESSLPTQAGGARGGRPS